MENTNNNEAPRRIRLDLNVPAELAIRKAVDEVEAMGADPKLTNAVILLGEAREMVADFIDKVPENETEAEITFGEKVVRTRFNPSNAGNVNFFKDSTAKILNVINENRDLDPRLAALAITAYEEAAMWAVKLATSKL